MKNKSLFVVLMAGIFSFTIPTSSAHAENIQRNRWEGIAIGLGTAIIGNALLNHHQYQQPVSQPRTPPIPESGHIPYRDSYNRNHHHRHGYWEIREQWVSPMYKEVWNPGHYTHRGQWVPGQWIDIEDEPGYWIKTRVWVSRR